MVLTRTWRVVLFTTGTYAMPGIDMPPGHSELFGWLSACANPGIDLLDFHPVFYYRVSFSLCACYAMSSTNITHYAVSGTNTAYANTRIGPLLFESIIGGPMVLCLTYEMSGTDALYAAIRPRVGGQAMCSAWVYLSTHLLCDARDYHTSAPCYFATMQCYVLAYLTYDEYTYHTTSQTISVLSGHTPLGAK
eukprot:3531741-Rhodomonas_salina.3